MMITCLLNISYVQAATVMPIDFHLAAADDKFTGTWQLDVTYKVRPPRRLRAKYMELVVGSLSHSKDNRIFVSYGPGWDNPCPSCTSLVDGFDRSAYQVSRYASFVAIAKAPVEKINAWAKKRDWSQIDFVSGAESGCQADYKCQGITLIQYGLIGT